MDEAKRQARVAQLHDLMEAGLRDEHADWVKAYGMVAAKVLEQRGADVATVQGLRVHPVLADALLTDEDKCTLRTTMDEVFSAIASAEQFGQQYSTHEVPAAILAALAHLYPTAQQRQPSP